MLWVTSNDSLKKITKFTTDTVECGLSWPQTDFSDYKIPSYGLNDLSPPFTYPATTYITFRFTITIRVNDRIYLPQYRRSCFGTIVNRRTVMTAASCLPSTFPYSPSGFNNDTIILPVEFTEFYPTWQSIYNVHLGIHNFLWFDADVTPTLPEPIDTIILVWEKFNPIFLSKKFLFVCSKSLLKKSTKDSMSPLSITILRW